VLYGMVLFPVTLSDPEFLTNPNHPIFDSLYRLSYIYLHSEWRLEISNLADRLTVANASPRMANRH